MKRNNQTQINVKCSKEEKAMYEAAAQQFDTTVSAAIRNALRLYFKWLEKRERDFGIE